MKYIKQLTYVWAIIIYTALIWPMPEKIPNKNEFTWDDKAVHLFLFFVLFYLITLCFYKKRKYLNWLITLKTTVFVIFYAIFLELFQHFVPGRDSDIYDFLAGLSGILLAIFLSYVNLYNIKPKLLLHICCIGCGAYVSEVLKKDYRVTLFFYNSNIYPKGEYEKRLEETRRIAKELDVDLVVAEYDHGVWLKKVRGLEKEPEKGQRCDVCFLDRLSKTANEAQKRGIHYFTTTLTVSPHKQAEVINKIGNDLANKHEMEFIAADFKKNDGFKKAAALSRDLKLYRQDYCGCEFSVRKKAD